MENTPLNLKTFFTTIKEDVFVSFFFSTFLLFLTLFVVFFANDFDENGEQLTVCSTVLHNHFYTAIFIVSLTTAYLGKRWTCLLHVKDPFYLNFTQNIEYVFLFLSAVIAYKGETKTLHVFVLMIGVFTSFVWHLFFALLGTSLHYRVWFAITTIVYVWIFIDTLISLSSNHNYYIFFIAEVIGMFLYAYGNFLILTNKFREQ